MRQSFVGATRVGCFLPVFAAGLLLAGCAPAPGGGAGSGDPSALASSLDDQQAGLPPEGGGRVIGHDEGDDDGGGNGNGGGVEGPRGAVGLAVEVDGGQGVPLLLKAGQRFWLNQIDVRASLEANVDEGVDGLARGGDFSDVPWLGARFIEEEFEALPQADGSFVRRRFYRDAAWMSLRSWFVLQQLDAQGNAVGAPLWVSAGNDAEQHHTDDFYVRRLRAIQWTNDCLAPQDCRGASRFQEEALVELRDSLSPNNTFVLDARTTALSLSWTLKARGWTIPVTQVQKPIFDYGFSIDLTPLTPPRVDGTYAAGSEIRFQTTLRDGSGARLHPVGFLPKYTDVIFGVDQSGIQYYRAFFDPTITYYRRKHRERQLLADFMGPAQSVQPIRSVVSVGEVLGPDDTDVVATIATDGVYGELRAFPTGNKLFGGAFDPMHAAWNDPVPDTWSFHVPKGAPAGTYYATIKGRRTFMGEDIPYTRTISLQVGDAAVTQPIPTIGHCDNCHHGDAALGKIDHANSNLGTCNACHAPLAFEYEGPIYVRAHFIHSRSRRYDEPLTSCVNCHLNNASIQRTSKSACLSCHSSYPADHVRDYGPITSPFIGGGPNDSFSQCTSTCHRDHPKSGL